MNVYLEVGAKRIFAGALDWPGWCRSGSDEQAALDALWRYLPRYRLALERGGVAFDAPASRFDLNVVERLQGNVTTDFGAPDLAPSVDALPVDEAELARMQAILTCCWQALDTAAQAAAGRELCKGARGGGRDLEGITRHVMGSEAGYLGKLAWRLKTRDIQTLCEEVEKTRQGVREALAAAVCQGLPAQGPRGGSLWTPRYFVRRVSWHILDHAWEIEDRLG